jgi:hypothetical protein
VGTTNVGSRAPACPPFIVTLRERGLTVIHDRRPRSGRGSDRFPDQEIRRSHSQQNIQDSMQLSLVSRTGLQKLMPVFPVFDMKAQCLKFAFVSYERPYRLNRLSE